MNAGAPLEVHLDALSDIDAGVLHQWRSDRAIRDGALSYPFPTSVEAEREWIRSFAPTGIPRDVCLAIRAAPGAPLLGYCQLRGIDWFSRVAELGIVIGEPGVRGQGLGGRALRSMLSFATDDLALRRIWLRVVEFNKPAIRMYEQAGFVQEGRLVRHVMRAGSMHDVLVYGWERENHQPPLQPAGAEQRA